jgi:hypothetical protein
MSYHNGLYESTTADVVLEENLRFKISLMARNWTII